MSRNYDAIGEKVKPSILILSFNIDDGNFIEKRYRCLMYTIEYISFHIEMSYCWSTTETACKITLDIVFWFRGNK